MLYHLPDLKFINFKNTVKTTVFVNVLSLCEFYILKCLNYM
nr:hypothetical protein [Human betaherpesvirus 6]